MIHVMARHVSIRRQLVLTYELYFYVENIDNQINLKYFH